MKLIAIEEHGVTPAVSAALGSLEGDDGDDSVLLNDLLGAEERLGEIGDERLRLTACTGFARFAAGYVAAGSPPAAPFMSSPGRLHR